MGQIDAPPGEPNGWLQVNCSVFVRDGPDGLAPYIPWSQLAEAVATWREEQRFDHFFFVRKPPGLRLRFALDQRRRLEPQLSAWLAVAEARNDLRGFRFTIYEPEAFRFGGQAGMALAHQIFDTDAEAAIRYEGLAERDRQSVARHELSVAITQGLLLAVVDDPAEVWDVWCRLREVACHGAAGPSTEAGELAGPAAGNESFRQRVPVAVADILDRVHGTNRTAGRLLRATADGGLLTVGVRQWLVASTIFHWNRWGLPLRPATLTRMLDEMVRTTSPDER